MEHSQGTPAVFQAALEELGHKFDRYWVWNHCSLRRCRGCGRVWRFKVSSSQTNALWYRRLGFLEPSGWTITSDLPMEPCIDRVFSLSRAETLLWNHEPCPGVPSRDYPGVIENAIYRLIALGVVHSAEAREMR
jgi:hypothetical protein